MKTTIWTITKFYDGRPIFHTYRKRRNSAVSWARRMAAELREDMFYEAEDDNHILRGVDVAGVEVDYLIQPLGVFKDDID